jgi:RNA polymerase sigma factor (sigma-70 family)
MERRVSEDSAGADHALVSEARAGDRDALEALIGRHQGWVYNIALRMLFHPADAEDATQEIMLKAVTSLASFEGRSGFRTWLYRIAFNHLLNIKRGRVEDPNLSFSAYGAALDDTPDHDPPDPNDAAADASLLVAEAMTACTSGMLLCLDREQRLAYILGGILAIPDSIAAEALEISPANFRQRLSRARRDLRNFMNDKCGLVNPANPCRCWKKTRGFVEAGHVDPKNMLFARERLCQVRDLVPAAYTTIKNLDDRCADIYRGQAFYRPPEIGRWIRELIGDPIITKATGSA